MDYDKDILYAIHKIKNNQLKKGDKVKIDIEKYRWQKDAGSITDTFWKFLEDNKDTTFTIFPRNKNGILWGVEEDTRWSLYCDYLIKV
jgi:hypothetical protein